MASRDNHRGYRFGEFELDLDRGALLKSGQEIPLRPKSFEVLQYLVENSGVLLSRQRILKDVWPGVIVTEDSLTQCLIDIRRGLDDPEGTTVRTVPRRGVIFDARVRPIESPRRPRVRAWGLGFALLAVLAVVAIWLWTSRSTDRDGTVPATAQYVPNSIAVLAFEDLSPETDKLWLAEGFAAELITALAQVPGLRVIARTSSFSFRNEEVDIAEIVRRLNVAYVVEGSVREQDGRLRISVQLIDGGTGLTAWSDTFESTASGLLTVQQSMVQGIAGELQPDTRLEFAKASANAERANELMLLALHYEQQVRAREDVDDETLEKAIRLYREATEADPGSARAFSRLAGVLLYQGDLQAAEHAIEKARALEPDSSEVQNGLGLYYYALGEPGAGEAFARAIELNPNNADALHNYAHWRWYQQFVTQGVAELYRRALELDPLSLARYGALGTFLAKSSRYDEARAVARRVASMFDNATAYQLIASLYELTGDIDYAIAWTLKARESEPENEMLTAKLAELYIDIGEFETALNIEPHPGVGLLFKMRRYDELVELAEYQMIEVPEDKVLPQFLAFGYMAQERFDQAIRILLSTGLPDSYLERGIRDIEIAEGFQVLFNSYFAAGQIDTARILAGRRAAWGHTDNFDWWVNLKSACEQAILGDEANVIMRLRRARQGTRLPWDPYLHELPCFASWKTHPEFLENLRYYESLREGLRQRLPATLAEFDVSL